MDATRWMPRIGAACAAVMLVVLAVPVGADAASTLGYDGTTHDITFTDPAAAGDRVRVEVDDDGNGNNWFGFHNAGGDAFGHDGSGCTTVGALEICPPQGDLLVFQLAGGNDFVDLTAPDLAALLPRPSETHGGPGNDEVRGGSRADAFFGDAGDDKLVGLVDADRFLGGDGEDTLDLSAGGPWSVSLDGIANDGPAASPLANVQADVEVLLGGPSNDALTGAAGKQTIDGRGGADTLDGGPDADAVAGGAGNDTIAARDRAVDAITCGDGTDTVTADWNDDVAADCEAVTRSVRDDDGDGSANSVDCNDANAAIKPGAGDVPGNGVDEDCDGSDAVLDRDGDGAAAGVDCDDANPARRPGALDVPANGIDEDCSGADAKRATVAATFASGWSVFARWTKLTKLSVKGAPAGAKLQVRCKGKGCPFARKSVKLKNGAAKLTKLFKGKKLKPGAIVELRVTATGSIGKVQRLTIRKRKDPKRSALCLAPGASKPSRCA